MSGRIPPARRVLLALPLGIGVVLLSLMLPVRPASAHPLDVYLQGTYLTLAPTSITVEIDLSPGVLVAPRVLPILDADGNHVLSHAEAQAYLGLGVQDAELTVDGRPLRLALTRIDVPDYLTIQAGYGTLRVFASAPVSGAAARPGRHRVFFRNGLSDVKAAYQVNAFVARGAPLVLGTQQRDPTQRQETVSYQIDTGTVTTTQVRVPGVARGSAPGSRLATYLQDPALSVRAVLLALTAAALLGALHALTPGHAKTLLAAYLVGSDGTVRSAAALGAVITVTHTSSVILIGLVALLASQFLLPGVLVPLLEAGSGVLVLTLGIRLLRQRWPRRVLQVPARPRAIAHSSRAPSRERAHGDPQDAAARQDHRHDFPQMQLDHARHQHGGNGHTHAIPASGVTARNLFTMGVAGGLVPCPEALGVMVLAVGVHRTVLGLGLIVAFSIGLAAVLIGLGVLLVRSRTLLARMDRLPAVCTRVLPLVSAAVVTVLGAGLVLRAVGADLTPL